MVHISKEKNPSADIIGSIDILYNIFGGKVNENGYRELNEKIGLIYGDSITLDRAYTILETLKDMGYASNNIVLGIQYHILQKMEVMAMMVYQEKME